MAIPRSGAAEGWPVVDGGAGLGAARERTHTIRRDDHLRELPSHDALGDVLTRLPSALFPSHYGRTMVTADAAHDIVRVTLAEALESTEEQVRAGAAGHEAWSADEVRRRAAAILGRGFAT